MKAKPQPGREAFIAYWKGYGTFKWSQLLWYVSYVGGLALYVCLVRAVDPSGRHLFSSLLLAVAYVLLVPYLTIHRVHTRYARYLRCPYCGDWFGQDAGGAYHGPHPKYRNVIATGRCHKCGMQIFADAAQ